jgi:LuxR family transcriptional regulator, quorum-sensing system regulator BjaR1
VHLRAYRNSFDHTIRFIHDLDRARNVEDISSQLLRHVGQTGAEHVIATTMPVPGATRRQQLDGVLFCRIPKEWVTRYAARSYSFRDPIIRRMTKLAGSFFWNEMEEEEMLDDPSGRRVLEEGSEFGLKKGFSTSMLTLDRQMVGFSLSGKDFDTNPEARELLTLAATYAIGRAIALEQESADQKQQIRLSEREREALQWASEGKADWEIGEIMSISEHGADKHLRSARSKLGAVNRAQAVAEAIRRGLIA